ncbi:MAG: ADP-ribosylglycohydrolase family protein, partial [Fimbriimonas sp.]
VALAQIPADSLLRAAVDDIREWHARGEDWESGFALLDEKWGYAKYGGGCHMIPNHALIAHALLQGQGDFHESMMVVNTCGLDTDCNAANVGTILGVRNGLAGLEDGPDWRGPVADRILLPTADVGSAISDAVQETYYLVNVARDWRGLETLAPKGVARYHFSLPNSVQGFEADLAPDTRGVTTVGNEDGRLKIDFRQLAKGRASRTQVQTFVTPLDRTMKSYGLVSSPILYPGQQVTAKVSAEANRPVDVALYVKHYNEKDELTTITAEPVTLEPGAETTLTWTVPDTGSQPICFVGIAVTSDRRADGTVYLDSLGWSGTPTVRFGAPMGGTVWRSAWIDAADDFSAWTRDLVVTHNEGTGMVLTGTREWHDYSVSADLYPSLNKAFGLAVRVQGLKRHYAFLFRDGKAQWVKVLDGETILNEVEYNAPYDQTQSVTLEVKGQHLIARIGSSTVLEATDPGSGLEGGGVAILVADGKVTTSEVWVRPLSS